MKIYDLRTKEPYCKIAPGAKICLEVEQRRRIGGWVSRVLVLEKTTLHSYKLKGDSGSINTWAIGDSEVYAKRPRKDGRYVVQITRPQSFSVIFAINSLYEQASFLQALSSSGATIMGIYGILMLSEHKNIQKAIKNSLEDENEDFVLGKRFQMSLKDYEPRTRPKDPLSMPQLSSRMIDMSWYFNDQVKERRYSAPSSMKISEAAIKWPFMDSVTPEQEESESDVGECNEFRPHLERYKSISEETLSTSCDKAVHNTDISASSDDISIAGNRKFTDLLNIFENKNYWDTKEENLDLHLKDDSLNTSSNQYNLQKTFSTNLPDVEVNKEELSACLQTDDTDWQLKSAILASDCTMNSEKNMPVSEGEKIMVPEDNKIKEEIVLSGIFQVSNSRNSNFENNFVALKNGGILLFETIENDGQLAEFSTDFGSKNVTKICMENLVVFLSSGNDGKKIIALKRGDQCIKEMKFENEDDAIKWKEKLLEISKQISPSTEDEETNNISIPDEKSDRKERFGEDASEESVADSPYRGLKRRMVIKRHSRSKSDYSLEPKQELNFGFVNNATNSISTTTTDSASDTISRAATSLTTTTTTTATTDNTITTTATTTTTTSTNNNAIAISSVADLHLDPFTSIFTSVEVSAANSPTKTSPSSVRSAITLFENQPDQRKNNKGTNCTLNSAKKIAHEISCNKTKPDIPAKNNNVLHNVNRRLPVYDQNKSEVIDNSNNFTAEDVSHKLGALKLSKQEAKVKHIIESFDAISLKKDIRYNLKLHSISQNSRGQTKSNIETSLFFQHPVEYNQMSRMDSGSSTYSNFHSEVSEENEEVSVTVVKEKFEQLSSLIQNNVVLNRSFENNSIRKRKNNRNKIKKKKTLEGESRRASIKKTRKNGCSRESSREESQIFSPKVTNVAILDAILIEAKNMEQKGKMESL